VFIPGMLYTFGGGEFLPPKMCKAPKNAYKLTKIVCGWGSAPDPTGELTTVPIANSRACRRPSWGASGTPTDLID